MSDALRSSLSASDIAAAADLDVERVDVPEWKGAVYLRVLPADEGIVLNEQMQALAKDKQYEALFLLLAACLADADGNRLFQSSVQAREVLGGRRTTVLLRLQRESLKLQGWLEEAPAKNA